MPHVAILQAHLAQAQQRFENISGPGLNSPAPCIADPAIRKHEREIETICAILT